MRYIQIQQDGIIESHITGAVSDYATLCGLDGDDPTIAQVTVGSSDRVNCQQCINIWLVAHTVPRRDLDE